MPRKPDDEDRRRRAEARLGEAAALPDHADALRLLHELQVHQIELELQNDELRAARRESEEAYHRYAELFEFAPIGYFQLDAGGIIREVNLAGARLLGVARGALPGRAFEAFVDPPLQGALRTALGRVLTDDREPDAPGEVLELALSAQAPAAAIRATMGRLQGATASVLLAAEDVTARRRAEDALREEAHRKDEFLAALSHELRNPLAPLRNAVYLLQRAAPDGERTASALAVMDRQLTHLARIVDDLLDVTRIARGKVRLLRERLELGAQLRRAVEDHRAAFEHAGVRLEHAEGPASWVHADASRIAQVLGNLLGNALKFTAPGGAVTVSLRRAGPEAVLSVRDTGVGIDPAVRDRLFEPFSQAPQTLDRAGGGLGLGLAMVKGLVEMHGGTVAVESDGAGRGAVFTVRLPLVEAPAGEEAPRRAAPAPAPPRRVLVVDDNEDFARSLADVLGLAGHDVRVALDGQAGLALARELRPQVIVCDLGLPGLDGFAVARRIRADPSLRETLLVAMSGYAAPQDVERARAAGFDRHVAKPPTEAELESMVAGVHAGG